SLLQLAFQLRDEREGLGVDVVEVENDQRRLFFAILLHPVQQILVGLHELDFDVHFAGRLLDFGQEEQVVDEGKDARVRISSRGQWLRLRWTVSGRKTRP